MATTNAIVLEGSIRHVPTDVTYRKRKVIDQAQDLQASGILSATTTPQSFDLSGLTAPGSAWFCNLDSGNDTVLIGIDSTGTPGFEPFAEISPGVPQMIELHSNVKDTTPLQYQASAGTVKFFYSIQDQ